MEPTEALSIIEALACGNDPVTGDAIPEGGPLHNPRVVRALFTAIRMIESRSDDTARNGDRKMLRRAGKPWDDDEDRRLVEQFRAGKPLGEIAADHQRSPGGIVARLFRLGHIKTRAAATAALKTTDSAKKPAQWWKNERPQAGKAWTADEDRTLQRLSAAGTPSEEIARQLGRGTHGVEVRLAKLSIAPRVSTDDLPF